MSDINRAIQDINDIGRIIQQSVNDSRAIALLDFEGKQKQRIFNLGQANDGSPIETRGASSTRGAAYTKAYEKKRQGKGRQIGYKDLMFEGDLEKGMVQGTYENAPVYGFINDKERLKAEGNQKFANKEVFTPSDDDVNSILDFMDEFIESELSKNGY